MQDRFYVGHITSNKLRLTYLERGNPDGPVMIFLHGLNDHCRTFDELIEPFINDYRIVTPDLRGHGDSEWTKGVGYDLLDYLYDLHRLVSDLDLAPATLVGHSLGGAVVALFSGLYPSLVKKLVLMEAMGLWVPEEGESSITERLKMGFDLLGQQEGKTSKSFPSVDAAFDRMREANPTLSKDVAWHLTKHGIRENQDGSYSWKYDYYTRSPDFSLKHEDTIEIWKQISCPVLVVNADMGLSHRVGHNDTLRYFQDARLEVLEKATHWIFHDQKLAMQNLIKKFSSSAKD